MLGTLLAARYHIIRVLGTGGFGQTYVAEDTHAPDHAVCVVKHLQPASRDPEFLEIARRLFQTEVDSLRLLGTHDQIPKLVDSFEVHGEFYLVQQYIDGFPFGEELAGGFQLGEEQVITLLTEVLEILDFVHHHRVIHRDIKPGNLIRRRDGKLVLIDFGAVKEIRTQIASTSGQSSFTVGIGTQGYTPGEQLSGKPRYSSDLYALGVTAIQALTGLQPTQIPEYPSTGELQWENQVTIQPGLQVLLQKMTRQHVRQRYQSAADVLRDLNRLDELRPEFALPELGEMTRLPGLGSRKNQGWQGVKAIAIASLATISLGLGIRQWGGWAPLELAMYDQMVRLRPDPGPDERLLVVEVTEADLQLLQRVTPSDATLAAVIQTLQQHQPRVIGVDLYRELPQEPGHERLMQEFSAANVIAITEIGDVGDRLEVPPPAIMPPHRIGFNDLILDDDNVVRRNLLFASLQNQVLYSFSLRIALKYLAEEGIEAQSATENETYLQLGNAVFTPLSSTFGGYHGVDAQGYQLLLDYRSGHQVAPTVSISQVLNQEFDPAWVRDRIVLIGMTAQSSKDRFYTPFSANRQDVFMPGVMVHTQMVSQILQNALDDRPVIWVWPNWAEVLWMVVWAIAGGSLVWWVRHPLWLAGSGLGLIVIIIGTSGGCFLLQGWVPMIGATATYSATGLIVIFYRLRQAQQDADELAAALQPPSTVIF